MSLFNFLEKTLDYFYLLLNFFVGLDNQYPGKLWIANLVVDAVVLAFLAAAVSGSNWKKGFFQGLIRVPSGPFTSLLLMAKVALTIFYPTYFAIYVVAFIALCLIVAIVGLIARLIRKPAPVQQFQDVPLAPLQPAPLVQPEVPAPTADPGQAPVAATAAPVSTEPEAPAPAAAA
jgi:hypothetical protein